MGCPSALGSPNYFLLFSCVRFPLVPDQRPSPGIALPLTPNDLIRVASGKRKMPYVVNKIAASMGRLWGMAIGLVDSSSDINRLYSTQINSGRLSWKHVRRNRPIRLNKANCGGQSPTMASGDTVNGNFASDGAERRSSANDSKYSEIKTTGKDGRV